MALFLRWDLEKSLHDSHLVGGDDAIGLGHLGGEGNHRRGERDSPARLRRERFSQHVDHALEDTGHRIWNAGDDGGELLPRRS